MARSARLSRSLALLPVLFTFACSSAPSSEGGPSDAELVGGREATATQFASTLNIRGNCTVAKVGPRHILTAAHCVVTEYQTDNPVRFDFRNGSTIFISNDKALDQVSTSEEAFSHYKKVTVLETHVHPGYAEAATTNVPVLGSEVPPDVAIIELTPDSEAALAEIPLATIDLEPVRAGDPLVIMGYGCELGVDAAKDYSKTKLKFRETKALGIDSQLHQGSRVSAVTDSFARALEKQYVFTPGQAKTDEGATATAPSEEASLCPGDSGGPVYRGDGSSRLIVGVNAYYSFKPFSTDADRVSVTNWHTRLDGESRFDVGSWLSNIDGVSVRGPQASDHFAQCSNTKRAVCGQINVHMQANGGAPTFGPAGASPRYELDATGVWRWTQRFANKQVSIDPNGQLQAIDLFDDSRCAPARSGKYCGVSVGDPNAKTLYTCKNGKVDSRVFCSTVCQSNPSGVPDACAPDGWADPCVKARSDGRYCGGALGDGNKRALYQCAGKQTFKKIECARSCAPQRAGVPDKCAE